MAPTKSRAAKPKATPAKAAVATDFQKVITDARERRENEKLANKIFSKGRRQSAPANTIGGGSLSSRVGVKKSIAQPRNRESLPAAGNINADWTHDLHEFDPPRGPKAQQRSSLASRVSLPSSNAASSRTRASKKAARFAAAVSNSISADSPAAAQVNILRRAETAPAKPLGMTIRGLAGPFAVMAQNFAPGTTEADIESAMTPVGGEIITCKILKTQPLMVVEMVFASREGGERVIQTFNDKTADGRLIKVYPKIGKNYPTGPRGSNAPAGRDQVIDGSMGFAEGAVDASRGPRSSGRGLHSDSMLGGGGGGGNGREREGRGRRGR